MSYPIDLKKSHEVHSAVLAVAVAAVSLALEGDPKTAAASGVIVGGLGYAYMSTYGHGLPLTYQ